MPVRVANIELYVERSTGFTPPGMHGDCLLPCREVSVMDSSFSKRTNNQSRTAHAFSQTTNGESSSSTGPYLVALALPRRRFRGLPGTVELSARDLIKPDLRMFQQFLQFLNRTASEATKESISDGPGSSSRRCGGSSASLGSG